MLPQLNEAVALARPASNTEGLASMPVKCTCRNCGKTFSSLPSAVSRGRGKYCSRACKYEDFRIPLADRFWSKIDKNGPIPEHRPELGRCWIWVARSWAHGYGKIKVEGKWIGSHRVAWLLEIGQITDDLFVLHKCDNPACCNPSHLFLGTHEDNMADMVKKGRARGEARNAKD